MSGQAREAGKRKDPSLPPRLTCSLILLCPRARVGSVCSVDREVEAVPLPEPQRDAPA